MKVIYSRITHGIMECWSNGRDENFKAPIIPDFVVAIYCSNDFTSIVFNVLEEGKVFLSLVGERQTFK